MKRQWQSAQAVGFLQSKGVEISGRFISMKNGLPGLKACSAFDSARKELFKSILEDGVFNENK